MHGDRFHRGCNACIDPPLPRESCFELVPDLVAWDPLLKCCARRIPLLDFCLTTLNASARRCAIRNFPYRSVHSGIRKIANGVRTSTLSIATMYRTMLEIADG